MDVMDYCNGVRTELTAWKAKLYDVTRKLEKLGTDARDKILPNVQDLNILIDDMQQRIKALETECPTEWSPIKKEIDDAHVDMRSKYEETMEEIGKAAPVSIPG
jgi:replicative DNA helicase